MHVSLDTLRVALGVDSAAATICELQHHEGDEGNDRNDEDRHRP
jgi:hypothetical protein